MIFELSFSILTTSTWLSIASRQIYISHHRTKDFVKHITSQMSTTLFNTSIIPFHETKHGNSNSLHYTMLQLVKHR